MTLCSYGANCRICTREHSVASQCAHVERTRVTRDGGRGRSRGRGRRGGEGSHEAGRRGGGRDGPQLERKLHVERALDVHRLARRTTPEKRGPSEGSLDVVSQYHWWSLPTSTVGLPKLFSTSIVVMVLYGGVMDDRMSSGFEAAAEFECRPAALQA